jgi:hypothetical protein
MSIWLFCVLAVYFLTSTTLVMIIARAAQLRLGLSGSALLILLWPLLLVILAGLYVFGTFYKEKDGEE